MQNLDSGIHAALVEGPVSQEALFKEEWHLQKGQCHIHPLCAEDDGHPGPCTNVGSLSCPIAYRKHVLLKVAQLYH